MDSLEMTDNTFATVYRFRDKVAFHTDDMPDTVYLTAEQAKKLARVLLEYSEDCDRVKFIDSSIATQKIEDDE